jgi:CHAD domain-containing protein
MAFRFKLSEPFEGGFKRIAIEQINRAQGLLKESPDRVVAVHETRKSLKRLRALLRLVRPALGEQTFHSENAQLREIAGGLSGTRDRHVLLETVGKLEAASSATVKAFGEPIRELLEEASNGGDAPTVESAAMKRAFTLLGDAKKRLARLRLIGQGFSVVGPGLEQTYRKARRAFRDAYLHHTDEAFHEWRKGTQQHWRHMALLVRAWPQCLEARTSEARGLSQLLGDDHDLALLIAFLDSDAAKELGAERIALARKQARERQEELRAIARPTGERLFAEGAKSLHRRIAAYWEAAVALAEHERDDEEPPAPKKEERPPPKRRRVAARA